MTTDQAPDVPRVRADGPGGFQVATSEGQGTPWWRLVGVNGEILGHSQVYASISNAHRGVEAAERTVIVKAHRSGEALYDVLLELDVQEATPDSLLNDVINEAFGEGVRDVCDGLIRRIDAGESAEVRRRLITIAAAATYWADNLAVKGGESS